MTTKEKEAYFPIHDRIPQEAFINNNKTSILSIRQTSDYFTPNEYKYYKENVFDIIFDQPSIIAYESKLIKNAKSHFIFISYCIKLDRPTFMMTLIGSHEKTMFVVSFSCPVKDREEWEKNIFETFLLVKLKQN